MTRAWLRMTCAATALPLVLGGCAAAAIPIAAGAVAAGHVSQKRHDRQGRSEPAKPPRDKEPRAVLMAGMTELPPPTSDDGYAAFARFAQEKAAKRSPEDGGLSVVLDEAGGLPQAKLLPCGQLAPAVVIDLDPGKGSFAPGAPGAAQPGLAARLAALRAAGITVLWQSALGVDKAQQVYDRLRATGLDPDGLDRLLLVRKDDERKQTRRTAALRDWCIVAIAGDRDGDFDELFDYLRDPSYAAPLAFLKNAGWFTAPPPIHPITTETPSP